MNSWETTQSTTNISIIQNLINKLGNDCQLPKIKNKKTRQPISQNYLASSLIKNELTDVNQRVKIMQGNLRMIDKRYRLNLKEGFDNKIKAYRLQAVMERKLLREKLLGASKTLEFEERIYKHHQAQRQYQEKREFILYVKTRNQEKMAKIKEKVQIQRQNRYLSLQESFLRISENNRAAHNKIINDHKMNSKKKEYFDHLRTEIIKRDTDQQKKSELHSIIEKNRLLDQAQQQLKDLYKRQQQYPKVNTFITI